MPPTDHDVSHWIRYHLADETMIVAFRCNPELSTHTLLESLAAAMRNGYVTIPANQITDGDAALVIPVSSIIKIEVISEVEEPPATNFAPPRPMASTDESDRIM